MKPLAVSGDIIKKYREEFNDIKTLNRLVLHNEHTN